MTPLVPSHTHTHSPACPPGTVADSVSAFGSGGAVAALFGSSLALRDFAASNCSAQSGGAGASSFF